MILVCCGSRFWSDGAMVRRALQDYDPVTDVIYHGDARGADSLVALQARSLGFKHTEFFADWETLGKAAGPVRNRAMFTAALKAAPPASISVLVFHDFLHDPSKCKGTTDSIAIARANGLAIWYFSHGDPA